MDLTPIKIPEIPLPFEIPVLMHPPIDHFIIALPIVILLIEIINLFAKKKAIGVLSFFLLLLTAAAAVAAYLSGTVDGKAAWDALSSAGQTELKAHKILGTYLMLASGIVLIFKLLSSIIQRGLMKALYLFVLIFFVVGILKQGQEGGELVYKYGANTATAKAYSDLMFTIDDMDDDDTMADLKEELAPESDDDATTEEESTPEAAKPAETKAEEPAAKETPAAEEPAVKEETKEEAKADESSEPAAAQEPEKSEEAVQTEEKAPSESAEATETKAEEPVAEESAAKEESTQSTPEVETVPAAPEETPEVATH